MAPERLRNNIAIRNTPARAQFIGRHMSVLRNKGLREIDRVKAVRALGKLCGARGRPVMCTRKVVPLLSRMVTAQSEIHAVRIAIAGALGAIGDRRALKPLVTMMGMSATGSPGDLHYYFAARAAIRKLRNIWPALTGMLRGRRPLSWKVLSIYGVMCKGRHAPLLCRTSVVPLLIARLKNRKEAANIAWALKEIGSRRAVMPLLRVLGRLRSADARGDVVNALGELGDKRAVPSIVRALGDASAYVRWSAANALGELGDVRALLPLRRALSDTDADVRKAARNALRKILLP